MPESHILDDEEEFTEMSDDNVAKLTILRQRAGDRYTPLVFYQSVLQVLAWITLALGGLTFLFCIISIAATGKGFEGNYLMMMGIGFGALFSGIWGFFILKVMANLILAITDVAVNSHLQVYLLSGKE